MSILLLLKKGAPFNALLFFVVVNVIESMCFLILLTMSIPPIAPEGS